MWVYISSVKFWAATNWPNFHATKPDINKCPGHNYFKILLLTASLTIFSLEKLKNTNHLSTFSKTESYQRSRWKQNSDLKQQPLLLLKLKNMLFINIKSQQLFKITLCDSDWCITDLHIYAEIAIIFINYSDPWIFQHFITWKRTFCHFLYYIIYLLILIEF